MLCEVLDIHTLLESQILDAVSYPKLLRHVGKVTFYCNFHSALLLILIKPNALQFLLDIEAVISLFIKMLGLLHDEPPLCILRLSRDLHYSLAQELDYIVLECFLTGVSCPDGDEALHEWLQVSGF